MNADRKNSSLDERSNKPCSSVLLLGFVVLAAAVMVGLAGCHAVDFYQPSMQQPVPPAMEPPRELSMISLPSLSRRAARLLSIEMLKLVPLPPVSHRHLRRAANPRDGHAPRPAHRRLLPGRGRGDRHARAGLRHGAGGRHDHRGGHRGHQPSTARRAGASRTFRCSWPARPAPPPVTGEYLVGPDGTINLKEYGTLHGGRQDGHARFGWTCRSTSRSISIRRRRPSK